MKASFWGFRLVLWSAKVFLSSSRLGDSGASSFITRESPLEIQRALPTIDSSSGGPEHVRSRSNKLPRLDYESGPTKLTGAVHQTVVSPGSKLRGELAHYEKLVAITVNEPGFVPIRTAIDQGSNELTMKELPNLEEMAFKETKGFSAQTKTATLWYLFHIASNENIGILINTRRRAAQILYDLSEDPMTENPDYSIAASDAQLAQEMVRALKRDHATIIHSNSPPQLAPKGQRGESQPPTAKQHKTASQASDELINFL